MISELDRMVASQVEQDELIWLRRRIAELESLNEVVQQQLAERTAELRIFQTMMEQAPDAIGISSMDGCVFYANPALKELLGYGDALIGMSVQQVLAEENQDPYVKSLQQTLTSGAWQGIVNYRKADGNVIPCAVSRILTSDEQGEAKAIGAIMRDMSQQLERETKLQSNEDNLAASQRIAHLGNWVLDLVKNELSWSDEIYRIFGLTPQQFGATYEAFLNSVHPDDWALVQDGVTKALNDNIYYNIDHRIVLPNGEIRIVHEQAEVTRNEQGAPILMIGTVQDVTEFKRLEAELRQSQALLQGVIKYSPASIFVKDTEGRYLLANEHFAHMLNVTPDYLIGKLDCTITSAETIPFWQSQEQQVFETGKPIEFETLVSFNGVPHPYLSIIFPIYDACGTLYAIGGIASDIKDMKRAEEERAALQVQVIQAQRVALRELSTPLIPLVDGVLIMPLIGTIDSARAQDVMEQLLQGIAQHRAKTAILDITGVQIVDTQVANALIRAAKAARLLGTQVILTGIQPRIAYTLVQQGIDLQGIITHSTLQAGITYAMR